MKTVLVIGGGGYVGTELQKLLIENGFKVKVYDTFWYSEGKWPIGSFAGQENLQYITGDVRNIDLLKETLEGVDSCIHLACISNDPSYELDPNLAREVNYEAFKKLIPVLNESSLQRFIYASSSSVYGVKQEPNVTEDLSLEPISDYSKYKAACEKSLLDRIKSNITTTIIRPSTVCGFSHRQRFDLVVNILTLSALTKRKISVDGGDQFRPNLHIKDMINCYLKLLTAPIELINREIFNVAGENLTVKDIALRVQKIVGNDSEIEFLPTKDARSYRVSGEKIARVIGFKPTFTIEDAIADIRDSYLSGAYPDTTWSEYFNIKRMNEILQLRTP
jgi:nucleoside-diphosphate-sugar epimerase